VSSSGVHELLHIVRSRLKPAQHHIGPDKWSEAKLRNVRLRVDAIKGRRILPAGRGGDEAFRISAFSITSMALTTSKSRRLLRQLLDRPHAIGELGGPSLGGDRAPSISRRGPESVSYYPWRRGRAQCSANNPAPQIRRRGGRFRRAARPTVPSHKLEMPRESGRAPSRFRIGFMLWSGAIWPVRVPRICRPAPRSARLFLGRDARARLR